MVKIIATTNLRDLSDAALIAYLLSIGLKPLNKAVFAGKVTFQFERTASLEKSCFDFYSKQTSVDALTLIETYHIVRRMMKELGR